MEKRLSFPDFSPLGGKGGNPSSPKLKPLDLSRLSTNEIIEQYSSRKSRLDHAYSHISVSILGGAGVGKKTFLQKCRELAMKEELSNSGKLVVEVVLPSFPPGGHPPAGKEAKEGPPGGKEGKNSPTAEKTMHHYRIHIDDRVHSVSNNSHVYLVFFDVTDYTSLMAAKQKIQQIRDTRRPSIEDILWENYQAFPCILVGNKLDYTGNLTDVMDFASQVMQKERVSDTILISALTGENFGSLLQKIIQVRKQAEDLIENLLPHLPFPAISPCKANDGCRIH